MLTQPPVNDRPKDKWGAEQQWDSDNLAEYMASVFQQWKSTENTEILISTVGEYIETIAQMLDEVRVGYLLKKNEEGVFGKRLELYQMQRLQDALDGLASMEEEPWLLFLNHVIARAGRMSLVEQLIEFSPFAGNLVQRGWAYTLSNDQLWYNPEGGHGFGSIMKAKGVSPPNLDEPHEDQNYLILISPEAMKLIRIEELPFVHTRRD